MNQDPNLCGPNFGPTSPVYPIVCQVVRVTGAAVATGYYPGIVQQFSSGAMRDRESCWVYDDNGVGLSVGYYITRLVSSYASGGNTYPLYAVSASAPGPGGPTTITVTAYLANVPSVPTYAGVGTLGVDKTDGVLGLIQDSAGEARIYTVAAGCDQAGYITAVAQYITGDKSFVKDCATKTANYLEILTSTGNPEIAWVEGTTNSCTAILTSTAYTIQSSLPVRINSTSSLGACSFNLATATAGLANGLITITGPLICGFQASGTITTDSQFVAGLNATSSSDLTSGGIYINLTENIYESRAFNGSTKFNSILMDSALWGVSAITISLDNTTTAADGAKYIVIKTTGITARFYNVAGTDTQFVINTAGAALTVDETAANQGYSANGHFGLNMSGGAGTYPHDQTSVLVNNTCTFTFYAGLYEGGQWVDPGNPGSNNMYIPAARVANAATINWVLAPLFLAGAQTVATITNSVSASGTTDTIADFTSLLVYATDAAAIHGDIYQLARKVKQIVDALRTMGIFV